MYDASCAGVAVGVAGAGVAAGAAGAPGAAGAAGAAGASGAGGGLKNPGACCRVTQPANWCGLTVTTSKFISPCESPQYSVQKPFHTVVAMLLSAVNQIWLV